MKSQRFIYQAGKHNAQTTTYTDADGIERCAFTKGKAENQADYTVPEYLSYLNERREAGSPEYVCLTWEELYPLITEVKRDTYRVGMAAKVTQERFWEMLEVLPPMEWIREEGSESFKVSELTDGSITACLVRIGKEYYELYHHVGTAHKTLLECCK